MRLELRTVIIQPKLKRTSNLHKTSDATLAAKGKKEHKGGDKPPPTHGAWGTSRHQLSEGGTSRHQRVLRLGRQATTNWCVLPANPSLQGLQEVSPCSSLDICQQGLCLYTPIFKRALIACGVHHTPDTLPRLQEHVMLFLHLINQGLQVRFPREDLVSVA